MVNLDYSVDFTCASAYSQKICDSDVTLNEIKLICDCIVENNIKNYLEIGVYRGASMYGIVKLFKLHGYELDAYGYDCFDAGPHTDIENSHTSGWPSQEMVQHIVDSAGKVKLIAGDSRLINKVITDMKFDFVFHDANHTKEGVIADLLVLKDILNPNAFVVVHNSAHDEPHRNFGGKSAIDSLVADGHYKFIKTADSATLLQLV